MNAQTKKILNHILQAVIYVVIAYVIVSWIPPLRNGPVGSILDTVVGPILNPINRIFSAGGIGFGAIILIFGIGWVQNRFLR